MRRKTKAKKTTEKNDEKKVRVLVKEKILSGKKGKKKEKRKVMARPLGFSPFNLHSSL